MTSRMIECLEVLGVDCSKTLERFLNDEDMYIKFLIKFAKDEHRQILLESVSHDDKENIQIAAHTLKGVSSNLGLEQLQDIYSEIVNHIRGSEEFSLSALMQEEKWAYQEFLDAVEKIKKLL